MAIVHQLLSDFRVVEFSQEPAGEEYQRLAAAKVIVNDYLDANGEPV